MEKLSSFFGLMAAGLMASQSAQAQTHTQTVTTLPLSDFDIRDIDKRTASPGPAIILSRPVTDDQSKELSLQIGHRPLTVNERNQSVLRQDLGDGADARLKWMKVEFRWKFGPQ